MKKHKIFAFHFPLPTSRRKGQAFAEFIIALIVLPLFITGTITIARMFMVNMRLHQAARHGAFLMATRRVTWTNTREEVMKYFTQGNPKFNTSNITITHQNVRVGLIAGDRVTVNYRLRIFDLGRLSFWSGTPKIEKRFTQSAVCGRAAF
ncbi:MAG: TadE family protein [Elusimicrobiota bacterium]